MKLCFPITSNNGVDSPIYGHFASSPFFLIYNTTNCLGSVVENHDKHNPYAGCNPFMALRGRKLDGIVVGGIGDEALRVMNMCGYRVYQAQSELVADNLALIKAGKLQELSVMDSHLEGKCSNDDGSPRSCSHGHNQDCDREHCS